MGFLSAWHFLTIIRLPARWRTSPDKMGSALAYFPIVGLLLGLLLAGLDYGLGLVLPVSVTSGLLLVTLVLVTGAVHLDGLIDTCDGLASGKTPAQRWEIMRDSRVGAFGVAGAFCLLLLKYVSLAGLPDATRMEALILMPVLGRWAAVCAIFFFPYARPEGLGRGFKDGATWPGLALATVFALAASVGFLRLKGLAIMFGVGLVTFVLSFALKRQFNGLTGDSYGAVVEIAEVISLLLAIAIPYATWSW